MNRLVIISAILLIVLVLLIDVTTYKPSEPTCGPTTEQCEQLSRIIEEVK